ncbi:MAG: hypothetical protein A3C58_00870 [Candidatus Staskawiczbacteria bacterium RIFCSPHIGHO2_02_FULL_34_10]|uniref:Uncharacterized protein n=1 Tax=Candidatus Staskawiczbacteria bacterium RIFCSPHIGHO2_02_FULL_34_10 TaxID=1802205 RepID=A0A1G2HWE5_9BACT|nr:MAG: hypothetical protein A3C58_00870 [Candidatus Staskawiczbacteria bacterium RIFCSPHIGHO2_02_FULL_34_10]
MRKFWNIILKIEIFEWFFGSFIYKNKVDRSKTTDEFKTFKDFEIKRNDKKRVWESEENYLVRYIFLTKKSPFIGDNNFREAKKLLIENGVNPKQNKF